MKEQTLYRIIQISSIIGITLIITIILFAFWLVTATGQSPEMQEMITGLQTALKGPYDEYSYESAGYVLGLQIIPFLLYLFSLIAAKKKNHRFNSIMFFVVFTFALLFIALQSFPLFLMVIAAAFFALYKKEKKERETESEGKEE